MQWIIDSHETSRSFYKNETAFGFHFGAQKMALLRLGIVHFQRQGVQNRTGPKLLKHKAINVVLG